MNLRVIKKDVYFFVDEFISDALSSLSSAGDESGREKVVEVINAALDLKDSTIRKINHPEGKARAFYRSLYDEFLAGLDALYNKLSEANKK